MLLYYIEFISFSHTFAFSILNFFFSVLYLCEIKLKIPKKNIFIYIHDHNVQLVVEIQQQPTTLTTKNKLK